MDKSCSIFINSYGHIYKDIYSMKIQDYNAFLLSKNKKHGVLVNNRTNLITFYNRYTRQQEENQTLTQNSFQNNINPPASLYKDVYVK